MSLNRGEETSPGGSAPSRRPWSLTLWLALFNAGSAFLILTFVSLLLYLGLAAQLKNQNHLYLHDELNTLERLLHSHHDDPIAFDGIDPAHNGDEYVKHFARLTDRNGKTVLETSWMAQLAPHHRFHPPRFDGKPSPDATWETPGGNVLIGTAVWVDLGGGERGVLEVAMDVTNVHKILHQYLFTIYLFLCVGLFFCIVISLAIARRGTRPLREMTEMVQKVSASSLKERVQGENWPAEVESLSKDLNGMLDRLHDSFERLYNSARNLSHKVRTPLTIMRGEAEVALSRERSVEELQKVIVSSLEENNRLVRLADNILFLADAEMGKFCTVPVEIDAGTELDKIIDFYSPIAEECGIEIAREGEARLLADPTLFRKAAAAIVSNAITYSGEGGRVLLSLVQGEGLSGTVAVQDTGCGIPEEEREKVFDRFYRVYATRHLDPHGTGLGLPIAKVIMDLHHGHIELRSEPQRGTSVTLSFPC